MLWKPPQTFYSIYSEKYKFHRKTLRWSLLPIKLTGRKNFTEFTGKHLLCRPSFNEVAARVYNFIKRRSTKQVFSCEFFKKKYIIATEHL